MDVHEHLRAAVSRAARSRAEAHGLLNAGYPGPALVWAVRAAELFMRDFVLAPHYMDEGLDWAGSMKRGSDLLGNAGQSGWRKALAAAEDWWGPFDEPLTEAGDNAWEFWNDHVVRRRGDIVHGRPVTDVTAEEAREVLAFVDRMSTWYPQRFLTSTTHPISREFRAILRGLVDDARKADETERR
jgi:hypothetical protein